MAGKSDIKAGRAYVELGIRNSDFVKGLRNASKQLKTFGAGFQKIGVAAMAAGTAIVAPFVAATKQFLDVGDSLDKMRQRTGLSVEALSELDHAAGQSGASLEDVENGVRRMQKTLTDAASGNKAAAEAFLDLGLAVDHLAAMSPEQQFDAIAAAIGKIEDPTRRAALAQEVLGKSGTKLLPMIEDLGALREEARAMGFTMSGDAAAGAVRLGDMLANLVKTVKFAGFAVAEILVGPLTAAAKTMQTVASTAVRWIKENRQLATTILAVGAGLVAAGAAITGFGLTVAAIGTALGGIASTIAAVGTALGVVVSPLGLVTAALVAGGVAWAKWTTSGQAAVRAVMDAVRPILGTFRDTFAGISNALMGGDLALAGKIGMAGLQVALLQGVDAISKAVGGAFGDFIGTIGKQIVGGDFAGAWQTTISGMAALWDGFTAGLVDAFSKAAKAITGLWEKATGFISDKLLALGQILPKSAADFLGLRVDQETGKQVKGEQIEVKQRRLAEVRAMAERARTEGPISELPGTVAHTAEEWDALAQNIEKDIGTWAATQADALAEAQAAAREQIGGTADAVRAQLDEINRSAQERAAGSAAAFRQRVGGGGASDAVTAAEENLRRLTEEAARLRAEAAAKAAADQERAAGAAGAAEVAGARDRVAGTFSAAAALALGQGGNDTPSLLKEQKREMIRQRKEMEEFNRHARRVIDSLRMH
jgi:hypothetical protein